MLRPRLKDDVDLDAELFEHLLTLTATQRVERHERVLELIRTIREAGAAHCDLDARAVWFARLLP